MSINDSVSSINVKEQIRLKNEEIKRKEEAQFRLVAKSLQKNENCSGPSLSNLYSTLNSNYSIGGHYSSLKTKKEDGSHYIPNINGQKKHNSLYSLSSDNLSSNFNSNANVLILNSRDISSKANLSEGNEFALTLNEAILETEIDKTKMVHLAEYFKMEYNDALKDALRTINMERKFEQRRRKNQDERWESLIKEGRGPSSVELELQRKDREKIDIMSKNREIEVTNCVNKNFENKLNFENEVKENIDNLIKRWKGKLWSELIDFLEHNGTEESSEEEEEEEESNESSNNEESESESTSEKEESEHEGEKKEEDKENDVSSNKELGIEKSQNSLKLDENEAGIEKTSKQGSFEILSTGEGDEGHKSELKIEQKLKKSLQSLKANAEDETDAQMKSHSMNSISANENQEKVENKNDQENREQEIIHDEIEDVEKSIQDMLLSVEELQSHLRHNTEVSPENQVARSNEHVERVELIDISEEKELPEEGSRSKEGLYDKSKEQFGSKNSLTQINTSLQRNLNTSKSAIEKLVGDEADDEEKLKSAPPVLEDDNKPKLLSPNTADNIKSVNPLHGSQKNLKTEVPYILIHQDMKALTYDYIKCKPRLSSECRSKVASEVIQLLEDLKLMRASDSTPLVAEPGVSILKRIMKKLKKNKPSENKFDGDMDYQTVELFGSHLDILYDIYKDIPPFLKECEKYILAKGIQKQGIFRISGKSSDIKDLKTRFQRELEFKEIGRQVDIASKIKDDKQRKDRIEFIKNEKKRLQEDQYVDLFEISPTESSVASVFKLFFRELVEPVFTFRMYKLWILLDDVQDIEYKKNLASRLILLLPYTHRLMLHYLLHFLATVASFSDLNDMTSSNLAKVFSPNLLRLEEKKKDKPSVESVQLHEKANKVIEFLIDNYEDIFDKGSNIIVTIEEYIKTLYDEEEQNNLGKNGNGKSKSHFSITKTSKAQTKSNRNSNIQPPEDNKKSPLTVEDK